MSYLVNFSHPLTIEAFDILADMVGDEIEQETISCQLDLEQSVAAQLDEIISRVGDKPIDLIIPPALSPAAAYVISAISSGYTGQEPVRPGIVVMKGVGVPRRYIPVDVI